MRKGKIKKAVIHTAVLMLLIASIGPPGLVHAGARVDLPTAPISTVNNIPCTFASNMTSDSCGARVPTMKSFFDNGLNTQSLYDPQVYFEERGKWGFDDRAEQIDSAFGDGDSAELVIGLSNVRPNSYPELVGLVESDGGKFANTVSIGRKVTAVVVDMPYETLPSFTSKVRALDLARYVEPNVKFKIDFIQNDPDWPKQWGPQKIEADWAWNTTVGDPSVLVAVVDTGIDYNHPDLARNYVPLGYDWVNNDSDPMDDNGHGTHCAGVIAAVVNNSIGVSGLAQVRVMAEKGLDESGGGSSSDLAKAIIHAVDQGANIISCSWGDYLDSTLLHEAIKYAHDNGVLVVAAAGNDAANSKNYPAAYDEVIAVTATDPNDDPAGFTNFGDWVEVAAPGVSIYSTFPGGLYKYMSGTSMSTPHVSGVAALVWSRFPNMTRDQVRAQLRYTAEDLGVPGFDVYYGYGRINARRAVEQTPAEHDVLILNWKTPSYIRMGDAALINTTMLNAGTSDENSVTVRLLVNGTVVDSVSVGFLASGSSTSVGCSWKPTVEGTYNVTSHLVPVMGETIINNNALSTQTKVRVPQVLKVPEDYASIQEAIDASFEGDTVFVASGTYYENVRIDKEDLTLLGEDQKNTTIDGQRRTDVVEILADGVRISGFTLRNGKNSLDYAGIWVYNAKRTAISDVTVLDNFHGIFLVRAKYATLRNNNMTHNTYNFGVEGEDLEEFIHDIDTTNTVDGKSVYYWVNEHDRQFQFDAGYVAVVNSTDIAVKNLNTTNNFESVLFAYTVNSSIENVNTSDSYIGTYLTYCNNDTAHNNVLTSNSIGIYVYESENSHVENNTLTNNENGILCYRSENGIIDSNQLLGAVANNTLGLFLEKCDYSTVASNLALNNTYGIIVQASLNDTFRYNNMTANEYNFGVVGNELLHFIQDIDVSNTVNSKPIYYWINQEDKEVPADAGYVAVVNSTKVIVRDLDLTNNVQGVLFAFAAESLIENVKATNNTYGIYLYGSCNDTIVHNTATSNGESAVQLVKSSNNIVSDNTLTENPTGVGLWLSSQNNTISANTILNGTWGGAGLYSYQSGSSTVSDNVIANNYRGILLDHSSTNTLRSNQITNNSYNFGVYGTSLLDYVNDIDASNTVNGKPIYYWVNQHDQQVPTNVGYVALVNSTGITAKNLDLSNNEQGILLAYTTNSAVMNVTASKNNNGIYVLHSDNNTLSDSNITESSLYGIFLDYSNNNTITYNAVTGNSNEAESSSDSDGISLDYSNNNTVAYNTVTDGGYAIITNWADHNYINSNVALRNILGIYLYYSHNSTVVSNKVSGGTVGARALPKGLAGIVLTGATGNIISENMVSDNQYWAGVGIHLEYSSNNNTITKNTMTNNTYGLYSFAFCSNNTIYHNTMANNIYGLGIEYCSNDTIYHNSLVENKKQVLSLNSTNKWDDGYPSGGNYWSDYTGVDSFSGPYQNRTACDGIGDEPYTIDENNVDNYPLLNPWTPPLQGDLNRDGEVNMKDVAIAAEAFGSCPGHPRWNSMADENEDGRIDMRDIALICSNLGHKRTLT